MKHIKRVSQAPTQLVLPILKNLGVSQEKQKKNKLFGKKKKIKKKKSKGRKLGYTTKGKRKNKKNKK